MIVYYWYKTKSTTLQGIQEIEERAIKEAIYNRWKLFKVFSIEDMEKTGEFFVFVGKN